MTSHLLTVVPYPFNGVVDCQSFYTKFCNTTLKKLTIAAAASATSEPPQPTSTVAPDPEDLRPNHPLSVAISEDTSHAGYFLEEFSSVAVLSTYTMSQTSKLSIQETLTKFLSRCREAEKTHLILHVTENGGRCMGLSIDIFKQLFPNLEPYTARQFRANSQV